MFGLFRKQEAPLQGYKVTNPTRKRRVGIAANSLKVLKVKAEQKFELKNCRLYLADDGSEVLEEEYFATLPAQTLFIVAGPDELIKTEFDLLYDTIRLLSDDLLHSGELAQKFLASRPDDVAAFALQLRDQHNKQTNLSLRKDHEAWFVGQDQHLHTKEKVLSRRSQDRIRGYFYKVKDDITKSDVYRKSQVARTTLDNMLQVFRELLIGVDYFGCLFDRKHDEKHESVTKVGALDDLDGAKVSPLKRRRIKSIVEEDKMFAKWCLSLCTQQGEFHCQGQWDEGKCRYGNHSINPYVSRENLILFQIWNLDHQAELSRTVIPSILRNVTLLVAKGKCPKHKKAGCNLSVIQYFLELFSLVNLKLVHIVCHDKATHTVESRGTIICTYCDEYKILESFKSKIDDD